jgi:tRNA dimethylallyltransferase
MDLLCIVGPTAVGKTRLSIELAKKLNGEIISGDAMQFYKGLDIGTAKATKAEQSQVKHHLLDILEPDESFSVAKYQGIVRDKISEIQNKNKLPILVGGSGLYIQSVVKDYLFKGKAHNKTSDYEKMSLKELQSLLKEKNPLSYEVVDLKNKRRVIRALEKKDEDIQKDVSNYYNNALIIGLNMERSLLYERINKRVYGMVEAGLFEEVRSLYKQNIHTQAIKAIGYKEIYQYFEGLISKDEAIRLIQRNSRRYAKRQLTWFRNKLDVQWFQSNVEDFSQTVDQVYHYIKKTH